MSFFDYFRGTLLYGEGQYPQAMDSFQKATTFRPSLAGMLGVSLNHRYCSKNELATVMSLRTIVFMSPDLEWPLYFDSS